MKSIFTKLLLLGIAPIAIGQTIVSTTPENRKVILEEFTGINCPYCPQGHAIAEQIMENNPGNAFAINIHQGGFATPSSSQPDFRTPFGNAIASQIVSGNQIGYPIGTVNRHLFPPNMQMYGGTGMDRGQWLNASNQILAMPSYLNMAVEASIDIDTRELIVHVESYYTDDSPESTNLLNVALLQNNTLGPQAGGGAGNNYNHMRRLVHLVTGQWGEEITTTTEGTFVDKTYTYTIPEAYNDIPAILSDMEIVVFMTETHQEIISGNGAFPSLLGLEYQNDLELVSIEDISNKCSNEAISPVIEIKNNGEEPLTSATIHYSINSGEEQTFEWTGNLTSLHTATIELPEIDFNLEDNNLVSVSVTTTDENNSNNSMEKEFYRAENTDSNNLVLEINTDNNGAQTRWIIRNSEGQMQMQGNGYGNNQQYTIDVELLNSDCYSFTVLDTGGNGGASLTLKDENGNILLESDGDYDGGFTEAFSIGLLGVSDVSFNNVSIYPNPTTGIVNINSKEKITRISIYDLSGKQIQTIKESSKNSQIDLSQYGKGVYIIKIGNDKNIITKRVILK